MAKRYGVPYQGSKNSIAKKIIDFLPPAKNFYDLFAGGCAITHAAFESGKFERIICNDINAAPVELFFDALHGKFKNESRWICREEFFALKEQEPYIKYCWSFSNNGRDYLYSKEIEPWKKAMHFAMIQKDFSLFEEMGIIFNEWEKRHIQKAIKTRKSECKEKYLNFFLKQLDNKNDFDDTPLLGHVENVERLQSLQSLQSLQTLQSLQSLQSLQRQNLSYEQIEILPDSIIYCDIPYKNTTGYNNDKKGISFDYEKFYSWAERQTELCFISEYDMP